MQSSLQEKAFKIWEHSSWNVRYDIFLRASELVKSDKYKEMILDAVVEETAASPAMAMLNWIASMGTLHDTAMLLNDLEGMTFPLKARQ